MAWVINTIAKLLLRLLTEMFGFFSDAYIKIFGINIGATFPKIGETMSLAQVLESYGGSSTSIFDMLFPMGPFKTLFIGMAITIATGLFVFELVRVYTASMSRGRKQHPVTSVVKYIMALSAIMLSYRIVICAEYIGNEFYRSFGEKVLEGLATEGVPANALIDNQVAGWLTNILTFAVGTAAEYATGGFVLTGITATVLNLIIVWGLASNFFKLLLECMERYVVLGMLFYSCPVAFSTIASEETRNIFSSWCRMLFSQMLLMITNGMFLSVAIAALYGVNGKLIGKGMVSQLFASMGLGGQLSWMIYMMLIIAWLVMGQRFDGYLQSLGLSTAQTGGALTSTMRAAAGVGYMAIRSGLTPGRVSSALGAKGLGMGPGKGAKQLTSLGNAAAGLMTGAVGKDTAPFQKAQSGANAAQSLAQSYRRSGDPGAYQTANELQTLKRGESLDNDKSRDVLRHAASSPGLRNAIDNASSVSLGMGSDGSLSAKLLNSDGTETRLGFGTGGGLNVGKMAGLDVSATGSASALDAIQSNGGKSVAEAKASSFANQLGGNYIAGYDNGALGYINTANKTFTPIGHEGSSDVFGGSSIGGGFISGAPQMATNFESLGHAQAIKNAASGFYGRAADLGFDTNFLSSAGHVWSPADKMAAADLFGTNPLLSDIFESPTAQITTTGNGQFTASTGNGSEFMVDLFDKDATGASLQNTAGVPFVVSASSFGSDDALADILHASTPGVAKEANKFADFLNSVVGGDSVAAEDYNNAGYIPLTMPVGDEKVEIGRAASSANAECLGGDWLYNGNVALELNEAGKNWLNQETGINDGTMAYLNGEYEQ